MVSLRIAICLAVIGIACAQEADPNWYKTATYYQVYPRSLKDTDVNGVGDLKGITESISYIKSTGADCIWLSPIYKSPMKDFGYDIADFYSIDPIFGTWEDFEELYAAIKAAGLRLLMDLIPNHTSNEHEWFIKSVAGVQPYADYYVWKPSKGIDANGSQIPPNNWLSAFAGSAWEWSEERQMFYLHQFTVEQPDLNYRNPLVLAEMQAVFRFWLQNGVDGFRIDAPAHIWEHEDFLDEPPSNDVNCPAPDQFCALNHTYVKDQEQVYDILYAFRQVVDEFEAATGEIKVLMSEASGELDLTMRYYGNETHDIIHFPFNFYLIWEINNETNAHGVEGAIRHWLDGMPAGRTANYVLGNHDNFRLASRVGAEFAVTNQMISFLLPGAMISYMGEEINMENTFVSWEETQDPQGCNAGPDLYQRFSRDPQRTPFQWNSAPFAGFTTGNSTWLPVNENYLTVNVRAQEIAPSSPLKIFRKLAAARKTEAVKSGAFNLQVVSDAVIAFTRETATVDEDCFVVVANTDYASTTVDLRSVFAMLPQVGNVFTASVDSTYYEGDEVDFSSVELTARGGLVISYRL